jgi:uncharacterized protein YdhG (YjbR/CyaY superfamily)
MRTWDALRGASSEVTSVKAKRPGVNAGVAEYVAKLPAEVRRHLEKMRDAIRKAVVLEFPAAEECISYGMPAFRVEGKPVVWYAAWKKHSSLYPISRATAMELAGEIAGYEISGKGTIQFPLEEAPPEALVRQLVEARIAELKKKGTIVKRLAKNSKTKKDDEKEI